MADLFYKNACGFNLPLFALLQTSRTTPTRPYANYEDLRRLHACPRG